MECPWNGSCICLVAGRGPQGRRRHTDSAFDSPQSIPISRTRWTRIHGLCPDTAPHQRFPAVFSGKSNQLPPPWLRYLRKWMLQCMSLPYVQKEPGCGAEPQLGHHPVLGSWRNLVGDECDIKLSLPISCLEFQILHLKFEKYVWISWRTVFWKLVKIKPRKFVLPLRSRWARMFDQL